jgi:hypothetical protein
MTIEEVETDHGPDGLHWRLAGPVGVLELIIDTRKAALVYHRSANDERICDGETHVECDAEMVEGDLIADRWRAADGDDQVVVNEMRSRYAHWQNAQTP